MNNSIGGKLKYVGTFKRYYEGEWKNNKMNGKGLYQYPNGTKYFGDFVNNIKQG